MPVETLSQMPVEEEGKTPCDYTNKNGILCYSWNRKQEYRDGSAGMYIFSILSEICVVPEVAAFFVVHHPTENGRSLLIIREEKWKLSKEENAKVYF